MKSRIKRHKRIRKTVIGTESKPRLAVFRSSKNLQAQLVNDEEGKTLIGMSTVKLLDSKKTKVEEAKELGAALAKSILALENGKYKKIVFDRGGFKYHGRIQALADSLREGGLEF
jgi:large subunit ribosomal protein L18